MSHPFTPLLLRALAVVIAVAAILDPAIPRLQRTDAVVAVHAAGDHAELVRRVERALEASFTVVRGPFGGAAATVLVGAPAEASLEHGGALFAVLPEPADLEIRTLHAPAQALLESRVAVEATVLSRRDGPVYLTLQRDGGTVDQVRVEAVRGQLLRVPLTLVPPRAGPATLRVAAHFAGEAPLATRDIIVDVRDTRWNVLFHDGRPSWMSTFVRRSIEDDPRFAVTARVVTSRDISTRLGSTPARLADHASLAAFDVIVAGAPETLTAAEAAALEHFMRRRGGSVLLLLDRPETGALQRLTPVTRWAARNEPVAAAITRAADTVALRARNRMWPSPLPPGASALLLDNGNPVVWRTRVGAGTLVVSGVLDAWQFRDPQTSAFADVWTDVIATLAHATPPPVIASVPRSAAPGEWTRVDVVLRDLALADHDVRTLRASADATLHAAPGSSSTPLRVWPAGGAGELAVEFRAPATPGTHRLAIRTDVGNLDLPLLVDSAASGASSDDYELLAAYARASGGAAVREDELGTLPGLLLQSLGVQRQTAPWHPMRSPWWLLPFALALTGEWWLRRRRGLR